MDPSVVLVGSDVLSVVGLVKLVVVSGALLEVGSVSVSVEVSTGEVVDNVAKPVLVGSSVDGSVLVVEVFAVGIVLVEGDSFGPAGCPPKQEVMPRMSERGGVAVRMNVVQ